MSKEQSLDFLIEYLLAEREEAFALPKTYAEKRRLFRSLVNIREPKAIGAEFIKVQDEFLQAEIKERGITDAENLQAVSDNIYLWRGDITTLKVDAIVNAANNRLLGCFVPCHACIDNAIHTYAGVQLRLECAGIMKAQGRLEPTGKAKLTRAYNLPSKYILHTVGPIISGEVGQRDKELLVECYRSCLNLAEKNGIKSMAFCCISTGEFRFPNAAAAEIAIDSVRKHQVERQSGMKIIFNKSKGKAA